MSGAVFALFVNAGVAILFAASFAIIAISYRQRAAWGFCASFLLGMLTHRRIRRVLRDWWAVLVGIAAGLLGGLVIGVLAAWSSGAGGPGRLADLGPDGLQVGIWAGIQFAVAIVVGMLVDAQVQAFGRRREPLSR